MQRCVYPEILDHLSPLDSQAIGSRRDLQRLNFCMGNARIMANALSSAFAQSSGARVIDLGSGDGAFLLRVARACASRFEASVDLVDRHPTPAPECLAGLESLHWKTRTVSADVFDWLEIQPAADAILCNLFLHHFDPSSLPRLLELISKRCRIFIACEPRRAWLPLLTSRLLFVIGCNAVTRHDAPVSVRAGFRAHELSALWPRSDWRLQERPAGLFTHLFVARQKA